MMMEDVMIMENFCESMINVIVKRPGFVFAFVAIYCLLLLLLLFLFLFLFLLLLQIRYQCYFIIHIKNVQKIYVRYTGIKIHSL